MNWKGCGRKWSLVLSRQLSAETEETSKNVRIAGDATASEEHCRVPRHGWCEEGETAAASLLIPMQWCQMWQFGALVVCDYRFFVKHIGPRLVRHVR
jgi:hypothetical protein